MKFIKPLLLIFLVFLVAEINVFALPVPVINNSFEDGIRLTDNNGMGVWGYDFNSGWDIVTGRAGTWMPSDDMFSYDIPDGDSVAWLNEGSSISQDLNHTVNGGNTLTLDVAVGLRSNFAYSSAFSVEIWAEGSRLASTGAGVGSISSGEFINLSFSYVIENNDPYLGRQLSIVFNNLGGGDRQLAFDNVHFDNGLTTTPVPEPATVLLLGAGLVGLAGFRRRKFEK